jgi:hypothetical protein
MATTFWQFSPTRLRSYLHRIPLATRALVAIIFCTSIISQRVPSLQHWGSLLPAETTLASCRSHTKRHTPRHRKSDRTRRVTPS